MVPLKSWVSENFGTVSKSRRFLCYVSKSRLPGAFSDLAESRIFSARSRSLGYFCRAFRNFRIFSDQTHIYLKDIVVWSLKIHKPTNKTLYILSIVNMS